MWSFEEEAFAKLGAFHTQNNKKWETRYFYNIFNKPVEIALI